MKKLLVLIVLVAAIGSVAMLPVASAHRAQTSATKAKLQIRKGKLGRFVVDAKGLTLYLFEKDKAGKSACYGACAKVWAPYTTAGKPAGGPGVAAAKIATTKRKDGSIQVTYGGHPLYHYDDDHKPGQTEGQGSKAFGAGWYVVKSNGSKIDKD
jgi:predicted lipoprotein with Yx(FWY)xxD motif